jgi:hypothetical protein
VLFCVLFVCKCVLPPGDNPTAVNKYIITVFKRAIPTAMFILYRMSWECWVYTYPAGGCDLLQGTAVVCACRDIFLASKYQPYIRLGCDTVWIGTEEGLPKVHGLTYQKTVTLVLTGQKILHLSQKKPYSGPRAIHYR